MLDQMWPTRGDRRFLKRPITRENARMKGRMQKRKHWTRQQKFVYKPRYHYLTEVKHNMHSTSFCRFCNLKYVSDMHFSYCRCRLCQNWHQILSKEEPPEVLNVMSEKPTGRLKLPARWRGKGLMRVVGRSFNRSIQNRAWTDRKIEVTNYMCRLCHN